VISLQQWLRNGTTITAKFDLPIFSCNRSGPNLEPVVSFGHAHRLPGREGAVWFLTRDQVLIQLVKPLHILIVDVDVVNLGVFNDSAFFSALRQRDVALLDGPGHQELGGRAPVFLGLSHDLGVAHPKGANQRGVGFDNDIVGLAERSDIRSGVERVCCWIRVNSGFGTRWMLTYPQFD
jgi:hypothetical protein